MTTESTEVTVEVRLLRWGIGVVGLISLVSIVLLSVILADLQDANDSLARQSEEIGELRLQLATMQAESDEPDSELGTLIGMLLMLGMLDSGTPSAEFDGMGDDPAFADLFGALFGAGFAVEPDEMVQPDSIENKSSP